jgi:hypothetical protein
MPTYLKQTLWEFHQDSEHRTSASSLANKQMLKFIALGVVIEAFTK